MSIPEIIGLGMDCVDVALRRDSMPSWEDPGVIRGFALANGGPAGTACAVAARFGVPSGIIDTLGNDEMTAFRLNALTGAGVDVSRMVKRDGPETRISIVYVQEQTGERYFSFHQDMFSHPLEPEELDRDYITSARYLHLDGCHPKAALAAAQWMKEAGKSVILDAAKADRPVHAAMRALVAETDVLICGSGFCQMLTGQNDIRKAGRATLDIGPRIVVQTEGLDGSHTVTADETFHTPAFEVAAIDTCGAGDVFHGAYLVGLVKDWDLRRIARFSSAVSAMHCRVLGNRKGVPSMEDVELFLEKCD
jgi:sulfofructose kinase